MKNHVFSTLLAFVGVSAFAGTALADQCDVVSRNIATATQSATQARLFQTNIIPLKHPEAQSSELYCGTIISFSATTNSTKPTDAFMEYAAASGAVVSRANSKVVMDNARECIESSMKSDTGTAYRDGPGVTVECQTQKKDPEKTLLTIYRRVGR